MPVTTTNILHLNSDGSHTKVEMNSGNVATPMLSFFNPKKKRGFILLAEQGRRFGNNGLFVEEDAGPRASRKQMTFVVSAPGVREQRYVMCGRAQSGITGRNGRQGTKLPSGSRFTIFRQPTFLHFIRKSSKSAKPSAGKQLSVYHPFQRRRRSHCETSQRGQVV